MNDIYPKGLKRITDAWIILRGKGMVAFREESEFQQSPEGVLSSWNLHLWRPKNLSLTQQLALLTMRQNPDSYPKLKALQQRWDRVDYFFCRIKAIFRIS